MKSATQIGTTMLLVLAVVLATALPVAAGALPDPKGEVLLVIKGAIRNTNVNGEAHFDRELLAGIGWTEIVTRTPWHEQDTVFEGVEAARVMEMVGARGDTIVALAANDYHVTIPVTDFAKHGVLLAMRIAGEDLTLRNKGPIWVIYPEEAKMPAGERAERMIWQLVELRIK